MRSGLSSRSRLAPSGQPHAQYTRPVQWPLAPMPVMLSGSIIAYYGHIRDSEAPSRFMYYPAQLGSRPSSRGSPIYSASLSHRAIPSTPTDPTAALNWFYTVSAAFAHSAEARRPLLPRMSSSRGSCNEAVSGSLSLRPDGLLALPRPGRLLSSFHPWGRPQRMSSITTRLPVSYRDRTLTG